jgi:predicted CopG family antitoxin
MEMTTIALPKEVKEKIRELGMMGENYSDVILRLMEGAREKMLHDFLMSSEGCVSIDDAIKEAKEKWPK